MIYREGREGILYRKLILISFLLCLMSCTQNLSTQEIYKPGREWIYKVSEFDSKGVLRDSFNFPLKVLDGTFFFQTQIQYSITEKKPDGSKVETSESTGVAELKEKIWLHPFRSGKLKFTELAPFPEIRFPAEIGKTWSGTITIGTGCYKKAGRNEVIFTYYLNLFTNHKGIIEPKKPPQI